MIILFSALALIVCMFILVLGLLTDHFECKFFGFAGMVVSVVVGFLMCGNLVEVKNNTSIYVPSEVVHTRSATVIQYQYDQFERTLVCTDALTYNAPTNKVNVLRTVYFNSYNGIVREFTTTSVEK